MSSAKRTQPRTWRTQYSGSVNSSPASRPVTFDAIGIAGGWNVKPAQTWRNSSSIGSIRAEWNAWLTRNRRVRRSPDQRASMASTASLSPDTTTARSAFTAARDTRSSRVAATSASVASMASIAPPAGNPPINRPRASTNRVASASDSTPATCAAAISPTEWPTRNSGVTPSDSTSRNNPTSTANNPNWVFSVRSRSVSGENNHAGSHTSSITDRNTGNASYRARPIPARCAPWPLNITAERPGRTNDGTTPASVTTARHGRCERPVANSKPTSQPDTSGCRVTWAASRDA